MASRISIVNSTFPTGLAFLLFIEHKLAEHQDGPIRNNGSISGGLLDIWPNSELIKSFEYITDYVMLMDLLESNFTINGDNHKK